MLTVELAASGRDETARSAVPGWDLGTGPGNSGGRWRAYNRATLAEPRWAETTLCGRQWIAMVGDEGADADEPGDEAFASTCRRCLAIMDKHFPAPLLDDRFALVVQIIIDTVAEHGYAEMRHVPGDQQAALRRQVRSAARQRTGHGLQTLVHQSMVVFICEPISQQHATEHERAAAEAMGSFLTGEPATPRPHAVAPVLGHMGDLVTTGRTGQPAAAFLGVAADARSRLRCGADR